MLLAGAVALAQGPGGDGGTAAPVFTVRPILVDVEFEGNDALGSDQLAAQIQTRPTQTPLIKRYYGLIADLLDQNPFAPKRYRKIGREMEPLAPYWVLHAIVDSLGGEVRYLNLNRLDSDVVRLRTLYYDNGYHDVEVNYHVRLDTVRNASIVRFRIAENKRYPLRAVSYIGLENLPPDLRSQLIEPELIEIGEGYSKSRLTDETDRIVADLRNNGYPFAVSRTPLILVARERDSIPDAPYDSALVFVFTGERYRFGETAYLPDSTYDGCTFSDAMVLAQRDYKVGEWYSRDKIDQTVENLYALGRFDLATVDTSSALSSDATMGMRINTRLRSPNDFRSSIEVGYVQRLGELLWIAGGDASYTRYNAFCSGGHLNVSGRFSIPITNFTAPKYLFNQGEGGGKISMVFPSVFYRPLALSSVAFGYDNIVAARQRSTSGGEFTMRAQNIEAAVDFVQRLPRHTLLSAFTLRMAVQQSSYRGVSALIRAVADVQAGEASQLDPNCDFTVLREALIRELSETTYRLQVLQGDDPSLLRDDDTALIDGFDRLKRTLLLGAILTADRRDNAFAPTTGSFLELRGEVGISFAGAAFAKLEGNARFYKPLAGGTLALRGRLGRVFDIDGFPLIPQSSRFFTGGANSMRAWAAGDLLATRPVSVRTDVDSCTREIIEGLAGERRRAQGGLGLVELNAEWRSQLFNLHSRSALAQQLNELILIAFVDAGTAFYRDAEDVGLVNVFDNIGFDIGFGIGYQTPVGPFRFGVAVPLLDPLQGPAGQRGRLITEREFMTSLVYHIGIGHAF